MGVYGCLVDELVKRIRAARAFARLSQPGVAERLEMSDKTYKLIELGQRRPKRSELLAIAEICTVPMWFLEQGWEGWRSIESGEGDEPAAPRPRDLIPPEDRGGAEDEAEQA
jgi:transcriptional regulator with XRE-family HTH domain